MLSWFSPSQIPSGYEHPLVSRGRQTTARGGCIVSHWHDEISMANSNFGISKLNKKNDRPSRYENVIERKIHAETEQKRGSENEDQEKTRIWRRFRNYSKVQDEQSVVPSLWRNTRKDGMMPEARIQWSTANCNVIGAHPRALLLFSEYLDDFWPSRYPFKSLLIQYNVFQLNTFLDLRSM